MGRRLGTVRPFSLSHEERRWRPNWFLVTTSTDSCCLDYWSKLETDGTLNWADAHLTPTGKEQARKVNEVLKFQFAEKDMPVPELYWSSPMWRCLQTAELSWAELPTADKSSHGRGGRVFVIKEMLREVIGVHTCDRRSGRSVIEQGFGLPKWRFEEGFGEADALWKADERESWAEIDVRMRGVLGQLFEGVDGGNEAEVVSFTAHSGAVASLLRVLGHRLWRLGTGGVIPVLVEATRVQ